MVYAAMLHHINNEPHRPSTPCVPYMETLYATPPACTGWGRGRRSLTERPGDRGRLSGSHP